MKKWTKIILVLLALGAFFVWANIARSPSANENKSEASVYFFDLGQGDSELIQKGDYQILIDGGGDDKVLSELGKVMPLTDRRIEVVILTHPHADHLIGINQILDRYQVEKIYYSGTLYDSNAYTEFLAKIKKKNIVSPVPDIGEQILPFQNGELTFLWPGKLYEQKTNENANNTSEVTRFCYFTHCVLFTGDIETDEQVKFISISNIQSEIMKLSHHGSTNGTNQNLIDAVKPQIGVIEVGANNKFGHPHTAVLDLLVQNSIKYYRTDRDGTIRFIIDEAGLSKK
jgi:competence protein ComEC